MLVCICLEIVGRMGHDVASCDIWRCPPNDDHSPSSESSRTSDQRLVDTSLGFFGRMSGERDLIGSNELTGVLSALLGEWHWALSRGMFTKETPLGGIGGRLGCQRSVGFVSQAGGVCRLDSACASVPHPHCAKGAKTKLIMKVSIIACAQRHLPPLSTRGQPHQYVKSWQSLFLFAAQ